jgi:hypothetical protein
MMKWNGLAFLFLLACGNAPIAKVNEPLKTLRSDSIVPIETRYKQLNDSVQSLKMGWQSQLKAGENESHLLRQSAESFTNLIYQTYFQIWDGTPWAFYGTTRVPQKGSIACGYFVTTVLADMGVPIQRIEMAKTYSEKMIRTLVQTENIKKFTPFILKKFVEELKRKNNGVYLVGLDNHTGFIVVKNHEVYFIHSSVIYPGCVVREKALESVALQINSYTVLGCLTEDKVFMKKWILH